jgi:hypothetical protein
MKELLIKIKALFEGQGTDQAKAAVEGIGSAADKAGSGGLGKLQGWIDGAAAKAGILGGAVSALGAGLISFASGALTSVITGLQQLVAGFAEGILKATDFADQIGETMDKTGQNAQTVLVLSQAFKNAGMSADAVAPAVNKLQRALAGANEEGVPTAAAFDRLGLSVENLRSMSMDEAFAAIGTALRGIKDPTEQAQLGFDILGRSSVQLLAVLKDPTAFATAAQQVGSLGPLLQANSAEMGKFSDAVRALNLKGIQFFVSLTAQLAGDLGKAADAMNRFNAGPLGTQVGDVLRGITEWGRALVAANDWIFKITGGVSSLAGVVRELARLFPQAGFFTAIADSITSLGETGRRAAESARSQAQASTQVTVEAADATMARILAETQGNLRQGATTAQTSIAQTAAEGSAQLGLTAEQLKAATVALAQEMAKGNADVVTPAMQALTTSVQEGFARIAGEITSVATTLAEAQRAQGEANQEAIREAVAGLGEAQQAANAETGRAIQAAIAAVQQSNSALASSVASAIGSLQGQLANLQAQINSLASRA